MWRVAAQGGRAWGYEQEGHTEAHSTEQPPAADCLQRPLHSSFRVRRTAGVRLRERKQEPSDEKQQERRSGNLCVT